MDSSANVSGSSPRGCFHSTISRHIFTTWFTVSLINLPLFLFVLYVGFKQWRKRRSGFVMSHSDIFTFNMVALELLSLMFSCFYWSGFYTGPSLWASVGASMVSLSLVGQMFFHCLTCVERYLAVVHPVIYLRLKKGGGVTIRNVSIGCAWLLSFGHTHLINMNVESLRRTYKLVSGLVLGVLGVTVSGFCSVSVLCVLIRPRPGEGGRNRRRIDQSQRAAFENMIFILGALLLRFIVFLIGSGLYLSVSVDIDVCVNAMSGMLFALPSSLVLPLLFLHRAGKLPCLRKRR